MQHEQLLVCANHSVVALERFGARRFPLCHCSGEREAKCCETAIRHES